MNSLIRISAVAILAHAALSQSTYTVVPSYLATKEGARLNLTFLSYANMRTQWAEGELGNSARIIRGVGFRFDEVAAWAGTLGRRYASVRIACADGDHKTMASTFSLNVLSTPTQVYSGAVSLPGHPGNNGQRPQPWLAGLNFPFSRAYQHSGSKDLLLDFTLSGGTLNNGGTWSGTRPNYYYLDSPYIAPHAYGALVFYGNGPHWAADRTSVAGCSDSKTSSSSGPTARIALTRYQPTHWSQPLRNKTGFHGFADYLPSQTNVAFVYGAPITKGVAIPGVTCNKLYVDMSAAPLVRFVRSGFSTRWARAFDLLLGSATAVIPSNSAWEGLAIMTQVAFDDTGNGQLRLSQATTTTYPSLPPPSLRRKTLWNWSTTTATGRSSTNSQDFSVMRYTL